MENKSNHINQTNQKNPNTENILAQLKTTKVAISVGTIYVLFMIITLFLLFNHGSLLSQVKTGSSSDNNNNNNISLTIFATITFTLLTLAFMVILLPNFKEIKTLIGQIKPAFNVVIYTIFLILLFRLIPSDTLNKYAFIITPLTLLFGIYLFYQAFKINYISEFNANYERIKTILLFFSLITLMIIYYSVDPGGYIQKNLGYSSLLAILIAIFSFLYLMVVLGLQGKNSSSMKGGSIFSNIDLSHYNLYIWFINTFIIVFFILLGIGIRQYPDGFFSDVGVSTAVIIFTMLIVIIWACILSINYYPDLTNKILDETQMNLFKKSLLVVLGVVISGLTIAWLTYNIQNYMGGTSTFSLFLNIMLVLVILTFIYKIINVKPPPGSSKSNTLVELFKNTLFYIPCLFSETFDYMLKFFVKEYNETSTQQLYFLIFTILLILFYFVFFYLREKILMQGGNLLINDPINTDSFHKIATYEELNGTNDEYKYQYGISCWIYIDSMPPNTNTSYTQYTSLLNYGNKPNILYKAETNTLLIMMDQGKVFNLSNNLTDISNNDLHDENKSKIVYIKENVLLQKWNQIIINYNGGTLDVFINHELVKSIPGIVPYMSLDTLTVGANNGIQGGVCNLLYFKRPLTAPNIYYLYHSVKDKKIPVL